MKPLGQDFREVLAAHRRTIERLEAKIWVAENHPDGPQGAVPERRGQFRRLWRFRGKRPRAVEAALELASDGLQGWRDALLALSPERDPCPGFRPDAWARV